MVLCVGGCAGLGAPGPVVADRPGFSDGPAALPARAVQIEAGIGDDRVAGTAGAPSSEYRTIGQMLLRVGLGARTEARLYGNSYASRITQGSPGVSGLEDMKVGGKVNVYAAPDSVHSIIPSTGILVATSLPTGASGLTAGAAQPEAKVAANWTTSTPFSLAAELGYTAIETHPGRATQAATSVAGWWTFTPKLSGFVEGLAVRRASGDVPAMNEVDAGITYLANSRMQLDASIGHGVGPAVSRERFIAAGISRRW